MLEGDTFAPSMLFIDVINIFKAIGSVTRDLVNLIPSIFAIIVSALPRTLID